LIGELIDGGLCAAHPKPPLLRPQGRHQAEPDIADLAARYGEGTTVIDWASRLRCSACDGREVEIRGQRRRQIASGLQHSHSGSGRGSAIGTITVVIMLGTIPHRVPSRS
jgi:hypothetical protein